MCFNARFDDVMLIVKRDGEHASGPVGCKGFGFINVHSVASMGSKPRNNLEHMGLVRIFPNLRRHQLFQATLVRSAREANSLAGSPK